MSKLGKLGHFFVKVGQVAPLILPFTPLAPLAPFIPSFMAEAEAIHGDGNGQAKLQHVINLTQTTAAAINAQAGKPVVDQEAVGATAASVISAIIAGTKIVAGAPELPESTALPPALPPITLSTT